MECRTASPLSSRKQTSAEKITSDDVSTEDVEFQGVDTEVKEFNCDFYKLCSIGSLRSLDHYSPAKSQDAQKRHFSGSPCSNRNLTNFLSNCEKSKPTGLVKPTRPVTLIVNSAPKIPEHLQSNYRAPRNSKNVPEQNAKTTQVPSNFNEPTFQSQNTTTSLKSLPFQSPPEQNSNIRSPRAKVPTKFILKSSASRRRQHSKKDAYSEAQNHLKEGCGTAWIHLQANPQLSDPMVFFCHLLFFNVIIEVFIYEKKNAYKIPYIRGRQPVTPKLGAAHGPVKRGCPSLSPPANRKF